jgi:hypothetical protein
MPVLDIVIIAVAVVLAVLAAGGYAVGTRRNRARNQRLDEHLARADAALAQAYAQDKGWERAGLEGAARKEWDAQRPGVPLRELHLVEVLDRPGTESDLAVFRAVAESGPERLVLGRRGGAWYAAELEPAGRS